MAPLDAPVEALDSEGGQNAPPPDEGASRPRGRPRVVAPVERVRALAEEGLGAKAISRRLQGEGVEVSPRTVARWLQGELGL